jgi:hypothetical protein
LALEWYIVECLIAKYIPSFTCFPKCPEFCFSVSQPHHPPIH